MGISFRDTATSFTARFWGKYWQQRLSCALTGTSAARVLRMVAADRLQADRIATGGKNVHTVAREYGRDGYDVPVAQSTNCSLETHPSDDDIATNMANIFTGDSSQAATLGSWQDAHLDETNISADCNAFHSQAGASNAVDNNNNTDDEGSFCNPATSTTTSPKTSASFVSSSLTPSRGPLEWDALMCTYDLDYGGERAKGRLRDEFGCFTF